MINNNTGTEKAILYRHCDGQPEVMMPELDRLVQQSKRRLEERSYCKTDPEKIAGMMVVLSADDNGMPSLLPCLRQHDDIQHHYHVSIDGEHTEIETIR